MADLRVFNSPGSGSSTLTHSKPSLQPRENLASMFYTRQVVAAGNHVVEQNLSLAKAVAGEAVALASAGVVEFVAAALPACAA